MDISIDVSMDIHIHGNPGEKGTLKPQSSSA